jgi:predicted GNAT superfamily acetyltransferase
MYPEIPSVAAKEAATSSQRRRFKRSCDEVRELAAVGAVALIYGRIPMQECHAEKNGGAAIRDLRVRDAVASDHAAALALNNSAVPNMNELSPEMFAWLTGHADYFRVAEDEGGLVGFVIALRPGHDYWSLNYQWFAAQGGDFLYLDRVVVAEHARGMGVGRALYDDIDRFASGRWPRITLEVNLLPPNLASLAFHERLGFRRVGVREEESGTKAVVLMERSTSGATSPSSPAS